MNHLRTEGCWFVIQVAPRMERKVGSVLEYKGYEYFAPTYVARKKWSDRIKVLEEPLFPGYVFARRGMSGFGGLLCSTPGVIRILSAGGRPIPVTDSELDAVRRITLHGRPMPIQHVHSGDKVKILDGPFAGIVGIVKQIRNRDCLVLSVQLISQSIYVEVREFNVAPVAAKSQAEVAN